MQLRPVIYRKLGHLKHYDDVCVLVNPNVDCSDKELHHKNGYKTAGKNLYSFIRNGD